MPSSQPHGSSGSDNRQPHHYYPHDHRRGASVPQQQPQQEPSPSQQVSAVVHENIEAKLVGSFAYITDVHRRLQTDCVELRREEIITGPPIGKGTYSNVLEVRGIRPAAQAIPGIPNNTHGGNHVAPNRRLAEVLPHTEDITGRFALKVIKPKLIVKDVGRLVTGKAELAVDAHFLAALSHPNIVKIKAIPLFLPEHIGARVNNFDNMTFQDRLMHTFSLSSARPVDRDCSFILMERFETTLQEKIAGWKQEDARGNINKIPMDILRLHLEKIRILRETVSALSYAASKRVLHRDLKPANIGIDREGSVKLFDFGTARCLPTSNTDNPADDEGEDERFDMSGPIGSFRYMAPECVLEGPYNGKADVYSAAVVSYETMSHVTPYRRITKEELIDQVIDKNIRPSMDSYDWLPMIKETISEGWKTDPRERPTMAALEEKLGRCSEEMENTMSRLEEQRQAELRLGARGVGNQDGYEPMDIDQ